MKINVSNLATDLTDAEIRQLFECFGQVASVQMARIPGEARVDMPDKALAREAIAGLHGQTLRGRDLVVSEMQKQSAGKQGQRNRRPQRRRRRR